MGKFLASSGEVGVDLLDVDWSSTSVGLPDSWPLSLRNAVRILLTSKFSMWMAWGPELTFFCNSAYRRDTLGKKYPWALGRPASEVWSEIWDDIGPRIDQVLAAGEATWDESLQLFLNRSGYVEETYHTFSYSPLADDDGAIAGMLCVVAEVTEQVVADRRMRTLRDLGVGLSVAASETEAIEVACDHLATNPASLPFVAAYLFEDDGETARRAGTTGLGEGHSAFPTRLSRTGDGAWLLQPGWNGESVLVDVADVPDLPVGLGTEPPLQVFATPLLQPTEPHPYGVLVVGLNRYRPFDDSYRDFLDLVAGHVSAAVTDARALDDQRRRAERLAALDQAKTDFLANVSHELRTPLTLLLGPAEDALADESDQLPERQRRRVEMVTRNGRRMLQLVNSLLDYSRLEAGEDDARFSLVDVGAYTAELVSMFESVAERVGLDLVVECEPARAFLDRDHWSKIVVNLLSNAMKFTFEGSITVTVAQQDEHVLLSVRDTGTGIPSDEIPKLFDRFHRVSGAASRTHEGSGIGLALVEQLVSAHGGTIEADSAVGVGTTFVVRIPTGSDHLPPEHLQQPGSGDESWTQRHEARVLTHVATWSSEQSDSVAPDPASRAPLSGDSPASARHRVLVVDDNEDMRSYVSSLLLDEGYVVDVAPDGVAALEQLRRQAPDLVLTDVMMPRLDGFGLVRAMQADPALTAIPVIMVSARAGEEGTLEALDAGVNDYLVKPFSARELIARVRVNLALERSDRLRDALERSKDLLDQAQRLAAIGSWEINLDEDTIQASDQFVSMLELSEADLREHGTTRLITDRVHPEDAERVLDILRSARPGDPVAYEARLVLPSGERIVAVRADVLAPTQATGRLIRGTFQDITDQRRTQDLLVAAEAAQEAAARERTIADALQRSLLPSQSVDLPGLDVATHYLAGTEGTHVGGDWYDLVDLGAGRVLLVIGDVMGRGVQAAVVTGQLRSAVRAFATIDLPPADLLEQLDILVADLERDQIVTCFVGVIDVIDNVISYASAGHPPVLITGPSGVRRLSATGPPLGAGFFGIETEMAPVRSGESLVLYTDGLVERRDSDLYADIDRLEEQAATLYELASTDQLARLRDHFAADDSSGDDVALVLVRLTDPPTDDRVVLRLPHDETAPAMGRRTVVDHLSSRGVPEEVVASAALAVSELVTNAVLHARPPITLRMSSTQSRALLEISDRTLLRPRRQRPDDDDEHGRGVNIVEAVSSAWGILRHDRGKTVWCQFDWNLDSP